MYLGRKPQRRAPHLRLILLALIDLALGFILYLKIYQPQWSRPFEPSPTPTRPPQWYIAEAEAYYGQGQLDPAISAYEQAVSISPQDMSARIRLAQFLILRQRTAEAAEQAKEATLLEPSNPQALATLCRALDWEGEYAPAMDACECSAELDPQYAEAYAYRAEVYADLNDWIPARQYAQKAVDLNYQSMDAHRNLGYVLEKQGRYRQAVDAYENAIVLHPKLASLYISAGRNYRALGKYTEAIDRFEKAIRLDPTAPEGYTELGWAYYTANQYSRAIDTLEQATQIAPDYALGWGRLGNVYYVLQQYEEAAPALQQAIRLAEKDYLRRARQVVVVGQDTSQDPPRSVEVMRGTFFPLDGRGTEPLKAHLSPIVSQPRLISQPDQTCGNLIASGLRSQVVTGAPITPPGVLTATADALPTPAGTPTPPPPFLGADGQADLDLSAGILKLELTGVPQPQAVPYEAQLLMWPGKTMSLGYFQPDATGKATFTFTFEKTHSAPVDYYTLLGLSYVYLGQCDKGTPWLLDSLDIDSSPTSPAWQGLSECPENGATPTVENKEK
jgi:tetratricopeptide (TPR) repeat protein